MPVCVVAPRRAAAALPSKGTVVVTQGTTSGLHEGRIRGWGEGTISPTNALRGSRGTGYWFQWGNTFQLHEGADESADSRQTLMKA